VNYRPEVWTALLLLLNTGCASFRHADDSWWGPDKAKHFAGSFAVAAGTTMALTSSTGEDEAVAGGVGTTLGLGTGKELYDREIKRTYFSGKDLAWDLIGALLGSFAGAHLAED
jgi:putative lipoprotein